MIIEYCPKCRIPQNMLTTISETLEKNENDEAVKRTTVSYQCSVCNTFVRSEESGQKENSNIDNQGCDLGENTMINFSGVWVLNLEKSKLQSPPPESSIFHISHNEPSFSLDRTHIINGAPDHFTIELKTDGIATEKKKILQAVSSNIITDGYLIEMKREYQTDIHIWSWNP